MSCGVRDWANVQSLHARPGDPKPANGEDLLILPWFLPSTPGAEACELANVACARTMLLSKIAFDVVTLHPTRGHDPQGARRDVVGHT